MLIPNWQQAHKYLTVQLAAALAIVSQAYDYLPMLKQYIPSNYVTYIALAIILARIIAQPSTAPKEPPPEDGAK